MGNDSKWYVVVKGERTGPFSEEQLKAKIAAFQIDNASLVWKEGMEKWVQLGTTELALPRTTPPPLSGNQVKNTFVWFIAFMPLISLILEAVLAFVTKAPASYIWVIALVLNTVLCFIDLGVLEKAGQNIGSRAWALLVPVYLFRRVYILKQKVIYPLVWCTAFILTLTIPSLVLSAAGLPNARSNAALGMDTSAVYTANLVKQGHFDEYPGQTIEQGFNRYIADPVWDVNRVNDGYDYVSVIGKLQYQDQQIPITITFQMDKATRKFAINSVNYGGTYLDNGQINSLIDYMFSPQVLPKSSLLSCLA